MHAKIVIRRIHAARDAARKSALQPNQRQFRSFQVKQWKYFLQEAKAFREKHGHCIISQKSKANPELARWAKRQRYHYKQYQQYINGMSTPAKRPSRMTLERIEALNEIGFCWDAHEVIWEARFHELKEFYRLRGHFNVPTGPKRNDPLATWVRQQRHEFRLWKQGKNHSITPDRVQKLSNLGFTWEVDGGLRKAQDAIAEMIRKN